MRTAVLILAITLLIFSLAQSCRKAYAPYVEAGELFDETGKYCEFTSSMYVGNILLFPVVSVVTDQEPMTVLLIIRDSDKKVLCRKNYFLSSADLDVSSSKYYPAKNYLIRPLLCNSSRQDRWTYTVTVTKTNGNHKSFRVVYSTLVFR